MSTKRLAWRPPSQRHGPEYDGPRYCGECRLLVVDLFRAEDGCLYCAPCWSRWSCGEPPPVETRASSPTETARVRAVPFCRVCCAEGIPLYSARGGGGEAFCWGCWTHRFGAAPPQEHFWEGDVEPRWRGSGSCCSGGRWKRLVRWLESLSTSSSRFLAPAASFASGWAAALSGNGRPILAELAALARRGLPKVALGSFEAGATPRLAAGDPALRDRLAVEGYAVVAGALGEEEVVRATDLFWELIAGVTVDSVGAAPIRREDPSTWEDHWPSNSRGLVRCPGVGQSDFMWYLRTQPRVLEAFANVWDCDIDDLVVSFDTCAAFRPLRARSRWRTKGVWFHVDQNGWETGSEFESVQGFVALTDQDCSTGSLVVLPQTHQLHKGLFDCGDGLESDGWTDFVLLPWHHELVVTIPRRLVCCQRGDLVLWDSRMIHCNTPAPHPFDEFPVEDALREEGFDDPTVDQICRRWGLWSVVDAIRNLLSTPDQELGPVAQLVRHWEELLLATSPPPPHGGELQRLVGFVCMMPRDRVTLEVLSARCRAAALGHTLTHWVNKCQTTNEDPGRFAGRTFSALERRLVGFGPKQVAKRGDVSEVPGEYDEDDDGDGDGIVAKNKSGSNDDKDDANRNVVDANSDANTINNTCLARTGVWANGSASADYETVD